MELLLEVPGNRGRRRFPSGPDRGRRSFRQKVGGDFDDVVLGVFAGETVVLGVESTSNSFGRICSGVFEVLLLTVGEVQWIIHSFGEEAGD